MTEERKLDRRDFLRLSAVAAGGTMLAACGGTPQTSSGPAPGATPAAPGGTTPAAAGPTAVTAPGGPEPTAPQTEPTNVTTRRATAVAVQADQLAESPMLTQMAQAGTIPALAERLPTKPYVVPHKWCTRGKYGGKMRWAYQGEFAVWGLPGESLYGHSPLRWLEDGKVIGPGMAESWSSNDAATEWTMKLREGLKWSDGKPCTTRDVMFWWDDVVANKEHTQTAPQEFKDAVGDPAKIKAVDDTTLVFTYAAPQPIFADLLACWVKGMHGPRWIYPRHYMEQFHPKYNARLKGKKDWQNQFDEKANYGQNPACPTLNGWRLTRFQEGRQSAWERNPFYYAVSPQGDQLPYIDGFIVDAIQDPQVLRLRYTRGDVDYVHGAHAGLNLSDVAQLRQAEARAGITVDFWDSGSGTGSIMFLNYDYEIEAERKLFRDPRFRKALSHAYNRNAVRTAIYFNRGELTTGTLSPKAVEYRINDEARRRYAEWRDSAVQYDVAKANQLLDQVGMKKGADGFRTLPNGQKFTLRLEIQADQSPTGEHFRKNELMARDFNAVGVRTRINPVPQDQFGDRYASGKLHSTTAWEVGDGPNHLAYAEWVVPQTRDRWAPLHGVWYSQIKGTPDEKKTAAQDPYKRTPRWVAPEENSPIARIYPLFEQAKRETDPTKRTQRVWDIMKIHAEDGPFFLGCVANYPQLVVKKKTLKNVPSGAELKRFAQGGWTNPWIMPSPAVYDPEMYFWEDPENHNQ